MVDTNKKNQIEKEIAAEEKFPSKIIQDKSGIFVDYNHESASSKLSNISILESNQRITYVRHLVNILNELGPEGTNLLKKLFEDIMKDRDQLKRALLVQVPELIKYLQKMQSNAYQNVKNLIIPLLVNYLHQNPLDVKQQAGKYLAQVSHTLNDKDRGQCILKYVIQMAHDDSNQQNRTVAVQLFSKMASDFGRDLCQQFIGLQILSLGEDSHLKVRKQAIINLPIISKEVSTAFFKNRFFKFFQKKSNQNNWNIRKSCVQIMNELIPFCEESLLEVQTQIYLNFFKDTNKWVKIAAYKNLGHFISGLKGKFIHQKLLDAFTKMMTYEVNDLTSQNQMYYSCAYDFPAVLDAVGVSKWDYLYQTYQKLVKTQDKKIKKVMASSLHEIAKIIGEKYTRTQLFNILDTFLKDNNDQIKLGVIQNLSEIIRVLDKNKREELIDIFLSIQKDQKKWRIRESIANQLTTLTQIYDLSIVFTYLVPIAFKFCSDSVSIVREEAAKRIGDIVNKFYNDEEGKIFLPAILQNIKGFSNSTKYTQRQAFVLMCEKLLNFQTLFQENFIEILKELAKDKIVNVRLTLAEILKKHLMRKGAMSEKQSFLNIITLMKSDSSEQIRQVFE